MELLHILVIFLLLSSSRSSPTATGTLKQGSFLSVNKAKTDVLVSPNGLFTAGFLPVGENAFCFAVWFSKSTDPTLVWMANRDLPVNGRGSKLSLTDNGNLVLHDAGTVVVWSSETTTTLRIDTVKLQLNDNGNLVLIGTSVAEDDDSTLWESFNSPTDTILTQQQLTLDTTLVSSKSKTNYSSGYYKLFYDVDNVLKMLFQGPYHEISSVYWPSPWLRNFENGRFTYNNSKTAVLDSAGFFFSSDNFLFHTSDYGEERQRRLTLDPDGNLRIYSFHEDKKSWVVTWQAFPEPCKVHGICGPNSFCTYNHARGRRCSCIQGFKMKNNTDWFYGCEPKFRWKNYTRDVTGFLRVANAEFYGYDRNYFPNQTLRECKEECLKLPDCKGFQFKFDGSVYVCFHKAQLLNGHHTTGFDGDVYVRVPKSDLSFSYDDKASELQCPSEPVLFPRDYKKPHQNESLMLLVWVSGGFAALELATITLILGFLYLTRSKNKKTQGYMLAATRFQAFTYLEVRHATRGFREEIGSGSGGTVYKATLPDGRVAAIKLLGEANQGEAEFLAEVSTIGKLHHMNLIELWGYCAEGKHRLLVYEYMEHGSLADNLTNSNVLDWEKRFDIAVGTAKGLAYLHEECLEWVLHCDVKPQNILLDTNYQPKVADFGLSKLQSRGESHDSSFSKIRGTRGYMAPEWVYNLPITSKVDVYSYGIVVLELVTGRKPTGAEQGRLVTWARERKNRAGTTLGWIEEIGDPAMEGRYEMEQMELLVNVAMQCVEEDKEARPTMRKVVEMLQCSEYERSI